MRLFLCLFVLGLGFTRPAFAQEPVRVIVLGTYHFGNPGLDVSNVDADDVTTAPRQRELSALTDALLAFEPNVVAVERQAEPPYLDTHFAAFSDDALTRERNEIEQVGYRLAKAIGTDRVYAIDEQPSEDEPDYFPYDQLQEFAARTGETERLSQMADWSDLMTSFEAAQTTETIPQLLQRVNGPEFADDFYWNVLTLGEGEEQAGPELAAYWFMRNAKIFNKLSQVTRPGDRVVVVYGAGHSHWLREMVERTDGFELEPVMPYLKAAADAL